MKATFGAGCFWNVEEVFRKLRGVTKTEVGFMGGKLKRPTYNEVSNGNTGYIEVIDIEFDPKIISYEKLLEVFWRIHKPTVSIKEQYASIIFFHGEKEKKLATKSKKEEQKKYKKKILTTIRLATKFHKAERYHQKYIKKHGPAVC